MSRGANLRHVDTTHVGISFDETTTREDVKLLWQIFAPERAALPDFDALEPTVDDAYPVALHRRSPFLAHPTFNRYHSETEMLRYLRRLADRDIAIAR
jgi:glycine dehydrogenase